MTTIAVHDLENSAVFYGEILELKIESKNSEGILFESGGGFIGIYQSGTAGTSQATSAWWTVEHVDAVVKYLLSRGITLEKNYDLPQIPNKNGIYKLTDTKNAAWFKDPDGNILGFGNF